MNVKLEEDNSLLNPETDFLQNVQGKSFEPPRFSESSNKKRKLNSEDASNPAISDASNPAISSGQFFVPLLSEDGGHVFNSSILVSELLQESDAIKRTLLRSDLKAFRLQIAMLSDIDGDRPIHIAVVQENIQLARKLCALMLKASIPLDLTNYLRQTPLHLAVMVGNKELVSLLLKCGSRVDLRDQKGSTALHLAAKFRAKKDILVLILARSEAKSIINMLDYDGYSALHYAVLRNNKAAIRCFHKFKADMNVSDGKSGRSPLIHSILDQNVEMIRLLLECGALPETTDYSGRSAFELSLLMSNKMTTRLLERNMSSNDAFSSLSPPPQDFIDTNDNLLNCSTVHLCKETTRTLTKRSCRSSPLKYKLLKKL